MPTRVANLLLCPVSVVEAMKWYRNRRLAKGTSVLCESMKCVAVILTKLL